jgi:hypothetical protein
MYVCVWLWVGAREAVRRRADDGQTVGRLEGEVDGQVGVRGSRLSPSLAPSRPRPAGFPVVLAPVLFFAHKMAIEPFESSRPVWLECSDL